MGFTYKIYEHLAALGRDDEDDLDKCEGFTTEGIFGGSQDAPSLIHGQAVRVYIEVGDKVYHGWFIVDEVEEPSGG